MRARPRPRAAAPAMVDDGAADLALLGRRIDELKSVHSLQALCLPEVLLPGQRMHLPLLPARFAALALSLPANGTEAGAEAASEAELGVLGTQQARVLSRGVRAHVTELRRASGDDGQGEACGWSCTLVGGQVRSVRQGCGWAGRTTATTSTAQSCLLVLTCHSPSRSSNGRRRWRFTKRPQASC